MQMKFYVEIFLEDSIVILPAQDSSYLRFNPLSM